MIQIISIRGAKRMLFGACAVVAMLATGQSADAQFYGGRGIGSGVYSGGTSFQITGNRGNSFGFSTGYGGIGNGFGLNNYGHGFNQGYRSGGGYGGIYGGGYGNRYNVRRPVYSNSRYGYGPSRGGHHGNRYNGNRGYGHRNF